MTAMALQDVCVHGPVGKRRSYHLAGVICPNYQEELGLLLLSGSGENMFGTQAICLGASFYYPVCCEGK